VLDTLGWVYYERGPSPTLSEHLKKVYEKKTKPK